ncbi:hypothetical protein B7463_g6040, partial [Scytalidium lignicola]
MSRRDCSFASQHLAVSSPSSQDGQPINSGGYRILGGSTTSLPNSDSPERSSTNDDSHQDSSLDQAVNFNHMELIIHLTLTRDMFSLGDNVDDYPSGLALALKKGPEAPYLLHQLLAFSARHLAFLHPERSSSYLNLAFTYRLALSRSSTPLAPWLTGPTA